MSEEIELAAKVAGESIEAFAKASGVFGPVKQMSDYLTSRIYYRQLPTIARVATMAAERIETDGLSPASVDDPLVLRILEESAGARDPTLQERWANLLANAVTAGSAEVRAAFPEILSTLESDEARMLDTLVERGSIPVDEPYFLCIETQLAPGGLHNLVRLGLIDYIKDLPIQKTTVMGLDEPVSYVTSSLDQNEGVTSTPLGRAFVKACQEPQSSD